MVPIARKPGWIALGIALVFHVLLLSLQTTQHGGAGILRTWLLNVLVTPEKLVDSGVQAVRGVWDGYFALIGVHDENVRLQAENDQLRMEVQSQDEKIREADRLRSLLDLTESGIGKLVVARVIGRDPSRAVQSVTINKGESSGIRPGSSVITPRGVVGRVIGVGRASAVVQLITDAQSEVAGMLRESRVQLLFKGTGGRDLELDYIDDDSDLKEGDEILTSGLDQIHPKGVPLGVILSVGPGELFKSALARPHVDMGRLEEVLVVIPPAKSGAEKAKGPLPSE
jgi:rod shape-determining protein MreC